LSRRNVARFLRADFHDDSGLKNCIEAFYRAIRENAEPPASRREIWLTAAIMDQIFEQLAKSPTRERVPRDLRAEHVPV